MREERLELLFTKEQIAERVQALAKEIAARNLDNLLLLPILKGAFVFSADLARALYEEGLDPALDFLTLSSYGYERKSEKVSLLQDIESEIKGRNILLIDDILESGKTLHFARNFLLERGAKQTLCAVLLDKPFGRVADIKPEFVGFNCPDRFVVGYGMDCGHEFRALPFIAALKD